MKTLYKRFYPENDNWDSLSTTVTFHFVRHHFCQWLKTIVTEKCFPFLLKCGLYLAFDYSNTAAKLLHTTDWQTTYTKAETGSVMRRKATSPHRPVVNAVSRNLPLSRQLFINEYYESSKYISVWLEQLI